MLGHLKKHLSSLHLLPAQQEQEEGPGVSNVKVPGGQAGGRSNQEAKGESQEVDITRGAQLKTSQSLLKVTGEFWFQKLFEIVTFFSHFK